MVKIILQLMMVLSIYPFAVHSTAQNLEAKPDKNPFGQPEILKYRPPVRASVKKSIPVDKNNVPELELTATLISVSQPMVIVNDKLLLVGEEIEGMRLKIIDEGRAVFEYRGKNHIFTIKDRREAQSR